MWLEIQDRGGGGGTSTAPVGMGLRSSTGELDLDPGHGRMQTMERGGRERPDGKEKKEGQREIERERERELAGQTPEERRRCRKCKGGKSTLDVDGVKENNRILKWSQDKKNPRHGSKPSNLNSRT